MKTKAMCSHCRHEWTTRPNRSYGDAPSYCPDCYRRTGITLKAEQSQQIHLVLRRERTEFELWYDAWLTRMIQTRRNRYYLELYHEYTLHK